MSNSVFALQVSPSIPPPIHRLDDLAKNFWFSWNPALGQLFRKLDPTLWRKVEASPRQFLRSVDQSILDHAATDPQFIEDNITAAIADAERAGISRKALTPYLLTRIFELTGGRSLVSNIALVENNARVAAAIAVALSARPK